LPALAPFLNPLVDQSTEEMTRRNVENTARMIETAVHRVAGSFVEDALASMREAFAELLTDFDAELSRQRELREIACRADDGADRGDVERLIAEVDTQISLLRSLL
jgi:hypothetical protein